MNAPLVYAVVLNWNGLPDTLECLTSLAGSSYGNLRVVVVDNASAEDPRAKITADFPEVTVLRASENLGFSGGNNIGILHALDQGADFVFLLNNDATVAPDAITEVVRAHGELEAPGFVGCKVLYADAPETIQFMGGRFVYTPEPRGWHMGDGEPDGEDWQAVLECDYVSACALLASSTTLRTVGLLDERFFLYWEDTEWGARAKSKGFRNYVTPCARVFHKVARSTQGGRHPKAAYYIKRNALLFRQCGGFHTEWFRRMLRDLRKQLQEPGRLRYTHLIILFQAHLDFARRRFGRHPAWLEIPANRHFEYRVRRGVHRVDTIVRFLLILLGFPKASRLRRNGGEPPLPHPPIELPSDDKETPLFVDKA